MTIDFTALLNRLMKGEALSPEEAEGFMEELMEGRLTAAQTGALLTALRMKGETVAEIAGCAKVMRQKAKALSTKKAVIDLCGTGGDGGKTFNISTTAAFVVAGAGLAVAKHGNRSVSSRCGSADVLEELKVPLNLSVAEIEATIEQHDLGFLFAPHFHEAMRHVVPARKELGVRTIFNLLGPLTNPASADYQLMGVYDGSLTEPLAQVLGRLGVKRAFVVHGLDGLDEISLCDETQVSELKNGQVKTYRIRPEDVGFERVAPTEIAGGDKTENAKILEAILKGEKGARRNVTVLNAAAALYVGGKAESLLEGCKLAEESLDSGRAYAKLQALRKRLQEVS